jgi:hypothetical protein
MGSGSLNRQSCLHTHSKEICSANDIFMCPLGDHSHRYLRLSEMCTFAKVRCYWSLSWAHARVGTVSQSRSTEDTHWTQGSWMPPRARFCLPHQGTR